MARVVPVAIEYCAFLLLIDLGIKVQPGRQGIGVLSLFMDRLLCELCNGGLICHGEVFNEQCRIQQVYGIFLRNAPPSGRDELGTGFVQNMTLAQS